MPYYGFAASDALHALHGAATSGCLAQGMDGIVWMGWGVLREKPMGKMG